MADGTLKVGTITTSSGSGTITLGQSGETINIPSGTTLSGAGTNVPAFDAYVGGSQTLTDATATKVTFTTERFDSDSTYDTSTSRFTPGVAGKYLIYASVRAGHSNNSSLNNCTINIYKNGSSYYSLRNDHEANPPKSETQLITEIVDSDADDYFEIYATYDMDGVNSTVYNGLFGACKLIGA
jgi:hypothetical protein